MDQDRDQPASPAKPPPRGPRAEREVRLAKALRDNLRRRKATGRGEPEPPTSD
jgi:hypothetical protein